ncbi:hypothetical protein ElyMa_003913000 [Elysia marginata]|uniref:Uncharacterized protein n=1 Tax=Elysia marginata TaxID=1093978 RepID=A0AAV4FPE4_9GAST|nr:hypothetical protein ElyMa_003913000 [Elysia marginata]
MKVEVVGIEGGYSAIAPTLEMNFQAGDKKKTPNLVVAYPDVLGTLSKYDMQQKLTSSDAEKTRIKGLFDEQFIGINDQIGGLASGDIYSLPIAKSIEMASVNTPVMQYILTQLKTVSALASLEAGET